MTGAFTLGAHPVSGRCSACRMPVSAHGVVAIALGGAHVCHCGAVLMSPSLSPADASANIARVHEKHGIKLPALADAETQSEARSKTLAKSGVVPHTAKVTLISPSPKVSSSPVASSLVARPRGHSANRITLARQVDTNVGRGSVLGPAPHEPRCVNTGCEALLQKRGVTRLVHVTYQKNLVSILSEGLRPGVPGKDELRLDDYNGALCFSLVWPNLSMFNKRCHDFPEEVNDHVVIEVGPRMVERDDAAFSTTNAAAKVARIGQGRDALERLFAQSVAVPGGRVDRDKPIPVPSQLPTSQQAEVLFTAPIALQDIVAVHFPMASSRQRFQAHCRQPGAELRISPALFAFWKDLCPDDRHRSFVWQFKDSDRLQVAEPAA